MYTDGKILVTGSTGFIGARIVETLYLSGKTDIRAGIWRWSSAARIGRFPLNIVKMDLMNREEIKQALKGVSVVIHCAKGPGGVTVEGTRNLAELALENKVERFIYLSTAEIYGNVSGTVTEDSPFHYTGNEYNETKIDAEKACWEVHENGLPLSVLRPSIVYGLFSKNWTTNFARMFVDNTWGIFEKYGEGNCNLIYVDDLVKAIFNCIKDEKAIGQAFNINGPDHVTWNEYFNLFNNSLGLPPLKVITTTKTALRTSVMEPIRMVGKFLRDNYMDYVKKIAESSNLAKSLMKKTEKALKTTPAPVELKLFNRHVYYESTKIKDVIGFVPQTTLDEGLQKTSAWVKHHGFLLS